MAKMTYEDFEKAASEAGLLDSFSDYDLKLAQENPDAGFGILNSKKAYRSATTDAERQSANDSANQWRSTYGNYTGGSDGSEYNPLGIQSSGNLLAQSQAYSPYTSRYGDQINQKASEVADYGAFEYDPDNELYQAYKKAYNREGALAARNALANASAATGGVAGSYAVTAAQQAQNQYSAALADKVPEIYSQLYDQYLSDYNLKQSQLSALQGLDDSDYQKYLNDRNYLLGLYDTTNSREQQELENSRYDTEYADSRTDTSWSKAMEYIQTGVMPTAATLEAAGIDETTAESLVSYYRSKLAGGYSGGSGSSGSSGGSGSYSSYSSYDADSTDSGSTENGGTDTGLSSMSSYAQSVYRAAASVTEKSGVSDKTRAQVGVNIASNKKLTDSEKKALLDMLGLGELEDYEGFASANYGQSITAKG